MSSGCRYVAKPPSGHRCESRQAMPCSMAERGTFGDFESEASANAVLSASVGTSRWKPHPPSGRCRLPSTWSARPRASYATESPARWNAAYAVVQSTDSPARVTKSRQVPSSSCCSMRNDAPRSAAPTTIAFERGRVVDHRQPKCRTLDRYAFGARRSSRRPGPSSSRREPARSGRAGCPFRAGLCPPPATNEAEGSSRSARERRPRGLRSACFHLRSDALGIDRANVLDRQRCQSTSGFAQLGTGA